MSLDICPQGYTSDKYYNRSKDHVNKEKVEDSKER